MLSLSDFIKTLQLYEEEAGHLNVELIHSESHLIMSIYNESNKFGLQKHFQISVNLKKIL